jgi:hypothetical protein
MFNDAALVHVPNFSNVHAAVELAAAHAHSEFGEMIHHEEEESQDDSGFFHCHIALLGKICGFQNCLSTASQY